MSAFDLVQGADPCGYITVKPMSLAHYLNPERMKPLVGSAVEPFSGLEYARGSLPTELSSKITTPKQESDQLDCTDIQKKHRCDDQGSHCKGAFAGGLQTSLPDAPCG